MTEVDLDHSFVC